MRSFFTMPIRCNLHSRAEKLCANERHACHKNGTISLDKFYKRIHFESDCRPLAMGQANLIKLIWNCGWNSLVYGHWTKFGRHDNCSGAHTHFRNRFALNHIELLRIVRAPYSAKQRKYSRTEPQWWLWHLPQQICVIRSQSVIGQKTQSACQWADKMKVFRMPCPFSVKSPTIYEKRNKFM